MSGLFDDVLGPRPQAASQPKRGGLFDDVLGAAPATDAPPDYSAVFRDPGNPLVTQNPLLGMVQRGNELLGSGVRGIANIAEPVGDWLETRIPLSGLTPEQIQNERQLQPLYDVADWLQGRVIDYSPTTSLQEVKDIADLGTGQSALGRAGTLGGFVGERVLTSAPDMAASIAALPAYIVGRTNEIATQRVANDARTGEPTLADLATAAPAATAESLLERFATRALPGLGSVPGKTAVGRVAGQTGIQAGTEAAEEGIANLGESLGTERGVVAQELLDAMLEGGIVGGGLGGAAQTAAEGARAIPRRPGAADLPADPTTMQDIVAQAQALAPIVQAEAAGAGAVPRQGEAPATPPPIEPKLDTPAAPATPSVAEAPAVLAPAQPQQAESRPVAQIPAGQAEKLQPQGPPDSGDQGADGDEAAAAVYQRAYESKYSEDRWLSQEMYARAGADIARFVRNKDADGLIGRNLGDPSASTAARAVFESMTGVKLPRGRRASEQAIDQWAGVSPEDRASRQKLKAESAKSRREETEAKLAENRATAARVNFEGGVVSGKDYIDTLISRGYDRIETRRRGAVTQTGLVNAQGDGFPIPEQQGLSAYARAASVRAESERRQAPTPTRTEPAQSADVPSMSLNQNDISAPSSPRRAPEAPAPAPEVAPESPEVPRAEAQRQPEAKPAPQRLTGLKNAVTDAERAAEGRDPIIREARKANRETVDEAVAALRETPTLGQETAARVASGGKVELKDEAVLLVHKADMRRRRDAAADRAQDQSLSEEARNTARKEYDRLVQDIDEVDQAAVRIGTESGRLLQLRRRMIAEDYSLPALERKLRMTVNRELKPGEVAELREMADKVAELQRKLDAAESKQAAAQVDEMLARLMKPQARRAASMADLRAYAAESRAALLAPSQDPSSARAASEQASVRAALDEALQTGSAADLTRRMGEDATLTEDQRDLGRRLAPVLERLEVRLVPAPADAKYAGAYDNAENSLWVYQADAETVLHEAVHGVTSALITSREAKTNPEVRRLVGELNDMLDHLRMQVAFGEVSIPADVRRMLDDPQGPLSNPKELLAYGMTEKPLQAWLATVPPPPGRESARSVWQAFKDAVSRMVAKVTGAKRSYLDALIESGGGLIDVAGADPDIARTAQREVSARYRAVDPAAMRQDPEALFHLSRIGAFHYADGAQDVAEWTRRMESDLGAAADQYRDMLPAAFKAAQAQASRAPGGQETVEQAMRAIGDQRRPRDVKRVVRAVVAEGARGDTQVFESAAQALDMDTDAVRAMFVQPEPGPKTLSEAQAEINRLRKELRAAQRPDPETRYQNQRAKGFQRRIAELEARIEAGDFAKRERVERELTKENERLRFEVEKAKERFHQYALEAEFSQRTPLGKLWGETVSGINFSRAIMTSLDLSAVFRQGGFIAFGNPGRASKAIPQMFKSLVSEKSDKLAMMDIMARDNAPLYKRAGLQLTGIGGDALSRVEETYASRWVDKLSPWAGGGLIRGSGRAYTAFLNRLRADSFDAMVAALARNGENPTKDEIKAIANYINVATGRGDILGYQPGEVLTATFFAPRLVASRFQLLAGQPLYGGSNRTRKMIAQEYARFLLGVSVAITLAAMMRDEDDETKVIELDPRSSDFGKVRFGDTYVDPLAGLAQVTVFLSRIGSGETRRGADAATSRGMAEAGIPMMDRDLGLRPIRDEYRLTDVAPDLGDGYPLGKVRYGGTDALKVGTNFVRSKLAPVPGFVVNTVTGKDFKGDPISPVQSAGQLVVPMSVGNLVDVMEANGMARGTAINLLGILGFSVQYRKPDAEELAEQQGGILGTLGVGTAEDLE